MLFLMACVYRLLDNLRVRYLLTHIHISYLTHTPSSPIRRQGEPSYPLTSYLPLS